jgi:cytochrome P450
MDQQTLDAVDILAPEVRADPFPLYARLRRDRPVCRILPQGYWGVFRFADAQVVLKNPLVFSSAGARPFREALGLEPHPLAASILEQDPPRHTRLRALISRAFTPRSLARIAGPFTTMAEAYADGLDIPGGIEFVSAYALPLPARVIADMLGLDPTLTPRYRRWIDDTVGVFPDVPDAARLATIHASYAEMHATFAQVIAARRAAPREDLVSELVAARIDGERLSDEEIFGFLHLLLPAGFETTKTLLSVAAIVLAARPDLFERIRADRSLVPDFVEETLRFLPPVHAVARHTTEATTLAGMPIPAGARVLVVLSSANRDERRFERADQFWLDRPDKGHIAFGSGIHHCIGAQLARMEARIALDTLLDRYKRVTRVGEVEWRMSAILRTPARLPLAWHRTA